MKKSLLPLAIAGVIAMPFAAQASDVSVYGKVNLSVESIDDGDDTVSELVSNASRFGLKGKTELSEGLYAIYKMEWEVNIDGSKDEDLSARNRYVGLAGDFGTIFAGRHDTPHKLAQNKVDLFNDLTGDIKNALDSENRAKNIVNYTSPKIADMLTLSVAWVASGDADDDDGSSISLGLNKAGFYLGAAVESDVEAQGTDSTRLVAQYKIGDLKLGALWEENDVDGEDSEDAFHVSAAYKIDAFTLKAQYTQTEISDSKIVSAPGDEGEMLSLGVDYKLAKKTKVFAFLTSKENDADTIEQDTFGIGMEHKF